MLAVSSVISLNVMSRQKLYRYPETLLLVLIIRTDKKIIIRFLLFTYVTLFSSNGNTNNNRAIVIHKFEITIIRTVKRNKSLPICFTDKS